MGARLIADFYARDLIDKDEACRICAFCSTSGPMFIVGTVGVGLLFNFKIGVIVLFSHILSAILNGLIYRGYKAKNFEPRPIRFSKTEEQNLLSTCMYNAMQSVLIVGGFIAFAYLLIDVLLNLGLLSGISKLFGKGITTGSNILIATISYTLWGTPKYTTPAPDRNAPIAARAAAPV